MSYEDCPEETIFNLRNQIQGCIGRARWYRDEGEWWPSGYENMVREVRKARALNHWVRRELRTVRAPQQASLFEEAQP